MTRDEYDPRVAFDDLVGDPFYGIVTGGRYDVLGAARKILHRAHRRRLHVPLTVVGVPYDSTYSSFEAGGQIYDVLGDDAPPIDLPVYGALYKQFSDAVPDPKLVRIDDAQSYADFRAGRGQKYIDQLAARLSALEEAVAQHVADHHGGGRVAALEEALRQHIAECHCGGSPIPLPLPGTPPGAIDAWQDGAEILCTVRFITPDGRVLSATSGTPAEDEVNEVVGCAIEEGVEPEELVACAPAVAQVLGATRLVQQLIGAAVDIIDCAGCEAPFVGVMTSDADPAKAAAMMLVQQCQRGDFSAMQDARAMSRTKSGKKMLKDATKTLSMAQAMKAGGVM